MAAEERSEGTRATLALVGFIVFIDMAGIGLILPVMPDLVIELTGVTIDRAAEIGGWLFFSYAIMQFIFAPIIGGLSDRYGRRPVLLFTLAALGLDYALMAWAPTLVWLFVGRTISGIMGATWAAANSCVADTVPTEQRGRIFGALGGIGALGFVLGPAIGGLLGNFDIRLPFIVASVLALGAAAIGWFVFKETLPPEKRRTFTLTRANPLGSIVQLSATPLVLGCLAAIFLMQLAGQAHITIWAYYGIEKFDWSTLLIGLTVTYYGVLVALSQGVATGQSIKRFGAISTANIALLFAIPSYLILAFATNTPHMFVGMTVGAIAAMTFPAMQQLMTASIGEDAQGELQGAIASTMSMTAVIGPPLMTGIFGAYADDTGFYFPGAPFILAAILTGIASFILFVTLRRHAGSPSAAPIA